MATISALITEIRTDINDSDSTRFADAPILSTVKKAIRRANRIVQRNGIQFAKQKVALTCTPAQAYIDISAVTPEVDVWIGLYNDALHKEIPKKTEREWELIISASSIASCLFDQANDKIYLNGTPSGADTLTLWYYPVIDPSSYTVASSTPWEGRIDDLIMEYARLRLLNIDEFSLTFDQALLTDFENQILQSYAPNSVLVTEGSGWL
jgi:hypothetical protein